MKILPDSSVAEFKDFINNHNFFYVVGHKEPDGDCIASCLGIKAILDHFEKENCLLSAGPFKRNEIIPYESMFTNEMPFQNDAERKQTGLIITDCSEIQRLGEIEGDFNDLDIFVIDHHKTSGLIPNAKGYINSDAKACAYLVQLFYEALVGPLPEDIAKIIFFGISTDTGFFRFLSTQPEDADLMEASSRLISYGAEPKSTYTAINSGKPYSTRKLLGALLSKAEQYLDGRLVITYETMEDTRRFGADGRDSDALYQLLLSAKDVEAVVFLRQDTVNTCTGGFRSQDKVDVSIVAAKFGGGGHKNASGMSTEGKLDTLIPAIVKEFARIM